MTDIRSELVAIGKVPEPPEGYEIARVDVVVRCGAKQGVADGVRQSLFFSS